jgi:hypothetical protein
MTQNIPVTFWFTTWQTNVFASRKVIPRVRDFPKTSCIPVAIHGYCFLSDNKLRERPEFIELRKGDYAVGSKEARVTDQVVVCKCATYPDSTEPVLHFMHVLRETLYGSGNLSIGVRVFVA